MILTWVAAFSCKFYSISGGNNKLYIGLWTVEYGFNRAYDDDFYYSNLCVTWGSTLIRSNALDGAMHAARAFGMIGCVLSIIAFTMILVPTCVSFGDSKLYLQITALIFFVLGTVTMLDLVSETRLQRHLYSFLAGDSFFSTYSLLYAYCRFPWLPISAAAQISAGLRVRESWRL